jgi:hypothetical protein
MSECGPNYSKNPEVLQKILDDPNNNLGEIAKKAGLDEKCQKIAKTHTDQFMNETKVAAMFITPFGGGGVAVSNNNAQLKMDNEMMESGCGAFSITANTILASTANISCNFNSTTSGNETVANSSNSISFNTIAPSREVAQDINETIVRMGAQVTEAMQLLQLATKGKNESDEIFELRLQKIQDSIKSLIDAKAQFQKINPTRANVSNSNLNFRIDSSMKVKSEQQMTQTVANALKIEASNVASAVAFNKISQATGVNALSNDTKTLIQNKVNNEMINQTKNINHIINNNKATAGSDNDIYIEIAGSVEGLNLDVGIKSQMDIASQQLVKAAMNIGNTIAASVVAETFAANDLTSTSKGLEDLVKASNDGLAEQLRISNEGSNKFTSSFMGIFGNIFMIGTLIAIAVVLFIPIVIPSLANIFPPPVKYALFAILGYLIFAWFMSWPPYSSPSKRTIGTERFMDDYQSVFQQAYTPTNPRKPMRSHNPYDRQVVLQ